MCSHRNESGRSTKGKEGGRETDRGVRCKGGGNGQWLGRARCKGGGKWTRAGKGLDARWGETKQMGSEIPSGQVAARLIIGVMTD